MRSFMESSIEKMSFGGKHLLSALFFPLCTAYMEVIFHISTSGRFTAVGLPALLLYAFSLGFLLYVPQLLIPNRKVRRFLGALSLAVLAVLFLIWFFVVRQFKALYDLKTILNGAEGVATGFAGDALKLIFSLTGITHILLFFLPLAVYLLWGQYLIHAAAGEGRNLALIAAAALMLECFLVVRLGTNISPVLSNSYRQNYNFQTATSNFGLMTSLRLEVRNLFIKDDTGFVMESDESSKTESVSSSGAAGEAPQGTAETSQVNEGLESGESSREDGVIEVVVTAPEVHYNELDIDFEALAASTSNNALQELDYYVSRQTPTDKNPYTGLFAGKNLIMICAEAFSGYVISEDLTPTLYRLANKGIQFLDFYQPASAGTTGGEFEFITGMLPMNGGASMSDIADNENIMTMGYQLNEQGYFGQMYHNNDWTFYHRDYTHFEFGYSEGYMGYGNGMEAFITPQWPQSDLEMIEGTFPLYADEDHFNVYYMTVSGHSLYSPDSNAMTRKHWDKVQDLPYNDMVKGYIAANLELEAALTRLLELLEEKGKLNDTVICLVGDHFPYGLDDDGPIELLHNLNNLYGYTVENYLQRDENRAILWCGSLENMDPIVVSGPSTSLDLLPTLLNLFGIDYDSRLLVGRDVLSNTPPLAFDIRGDWKTDLGTYISTEGAFTPASETVQVPENYVEDMNIIVRNKLRYCQNVIDQDYFAHVFGEK